MTSFFETADWRIYPDAQRFERGEHQETVPARTMQVLVYLIEHRDRVVTSNELLEAFWAGRVVEESTIHRRINLIRQLLGDKASKPLFIKTVPKRGYQFIAALADQVATQTAERIGNAAADVSVLMRALTIGNAQEALVKLNALKAEGGDSDTNLQLMLVHMFLAKATGDWSSNHASMKLIAEQEKQYPTTPYSLCLIEGLLKQFVERDAEAIELFEAALSLGADPLAILPHQCRSQYLLGRYVEAFAAANTLLQQDSLSPEANLMMAELQHVTGNEQEAQSHIDRATALGADQPQVLLRAARYFVWQGQYRQSLKLASDAYALDPLDQRCTSELMFIMLVLKDPASMMRWVQKTAELNPGNQAIAFFRTPDYQPTIQEQRAYVDDWRLREPDNRDWLRVSGEIELDFVLASPEQSNTAASADGLQRALAYYRQYFERGGEARFDEAGKASDVIVRNNDSHTMMRYADACELAGELRARDSIIEGCIDFLQAVPGERQCLLVVALLFVHQAKLGNVEQAMACIEALNTGGVIETTYFDLMDIPNDRRGRWHGVGQSELFREYYERANGVVAVIRAGLRDEFGGMFD